MRDRLDELYFGHAVLPRECEMGAKLVRTVHRDQRADGHQTAVALGELRTPQTSPNSTLSVSSASLGAMSPISC